MKGYLRLVSIKVSLVSSPPGRLDGIIFVSIVSMVTPSSISNARFAVFVLVRTFSSLALNGLVAAISSLPTGSLFLPGVCCSCLSGDIFSNTALGWVISAVDCSSCSWVPVKRIKEAMIRKEIGNKDFFIIGDSLLIQIH